MLLKAFTNIFVILYLCYEYHGATVTSSKRFESGTNSFTWNFIFPDSKTASDFNGIKDTITTSDAQAVEGRPPDIDIRFGETPIEDEYTISSCQSCTKKVGVYWREWKGKIPDDAIVAGFAANSFGIKSALYFAQAYTPQKAAAGIQPGQLFNCSTSLTVSFEGVHQISKSVKVLCGQKQSVAWVPVETTADLNPDTDFVPAGFERDFVTFFARSRYNDNRVIGKAVWNNKAMHFPADGVERTEKIFDILCYREKLTGRNIIVPSGQTDD